MHMCNIYLCICIYLDICFNICTCLYIEVCMCMGPWIELTAEVHLFAEQIWNPSNRGFVASQNLHFAPKHSLWMGFVNLSGLRLGPLNIIVIVWWVWWVLQFISWPWQTICNFDSPLLRWVAGGSGIWILGCNQIDFWCARPKCLSMWIFGVWILAAQAFTFDTYYISICTPGAYASTWVCP